MDPCVAVWKLQGEVASGLAVQVRMRDRSRAWSHDEVPRCQSPPRGGPLGREGGAGAPAEGAALPGAETLAMGLALLGGAEGALRPAAGACLGGSRWREVCACAWAADPLWNALVLLPVPVAEGPRAPPNE